MNAEVRLIDVMPSDVTVYPASKYPYDETTVMAPSAWVRCGKDITLTYKSLDALDALIAGLQDARERLAAAPTTLQVA